MRDGGYRSAQWWTEEGWRWRTFRNAKWPTFWVPEGPQVRRGNEFWALVWQGGWLVIAGSAAHPSPTPNRPPRPDPTLLPQGLHRYRLRLIFEVVDMAPALPAVVNHHEARAYANWLSTKQVRGACFLAFLCACCRPGRLARGCDGTSRRRPHATPRSTALPVPQIRPPVQGLRGDAALRLLTEPEHHRLRQVAKRDAEGRAAEDPGGLCGGRIILHS